MNLGIIAHNSKKVLIEDFCIAYKNILAKHEVYATGTTGRRIEEATSLHVHKFLAGSIGGDKQFMEMVERQDLDMVILFYNPVMMDPAEPDIMSIVKRCDQYNIPVATNIATAELLILGLARGSGLEIKSEMRVIAGKARRLNLKTIPGNETRPTTDRIKETLFNILQPEIPGCRFLDLFSGSGAIGIEALSRGADYAVFVEKNPKACACIRENLSFTKLSEGGKLLNMDVLQALRSLEGGEPFDCIFMDAPYEQHLEQPVLEYLADSTLANENTLIIIEEDLYTDFSYVEELGYHLIRSKEYKTNKHVFLKK